MYKDSEEFIDGIFLSYDKILKKLEQQNIRTRNNKKITHTDLRYAISVMIKKHPSCRWKSEKIKSRIYYILIEGYYWLVYVYFQNNKKIIDADIEFFEIRISQYEKILKLESKNLFNEDVSVDKLEEFFDRKIIVIKRVLREMEKKYNKQFEISKGGKKYITKEGIEILCKEHFKNKYLKLLEEYKMELTEKFISAGYIYDNYFGIN